MIQVRGTHPVEGEIFQDFTDNERELALAIGREWGRRRWNPRVLVKSWNGNFRWITSELVQRKMAA